MEIQWPPGYPSRDNLFCRAGFREEAILSLPQKPLFFSFLSSYQFQTHHNLEAADVASQISPSKHPEHSLILNLEHAQNSSLSLM